MRTFLNIEKTTLRSFLNIQKTTLRTFLNIQKTTLRSFLNIQKTTLRSFLNIQKTTLRSFLNIQKTTLRSFLNIQKTTLRTFLNIQKTTLITFLIPLPLPPGLRDFPRCIIFKLRVGDKDIFPLPAYLAPFGNTDLNEGVSDLAALTFDFSGVEGSSGRSAGEVTLSLMFSGSTVSVSSYSSVSSSV